MNVHWTETAIEHLVAIYERIAQDAPLYAHRMVDRLTRRSEQIATFPESGRMVPEYEAPDVREVIESPYRIITGSRQIKSICWLLCTARKALSANDR